MHTFFLQSRDGRFCGKVCNVSIIKMIDKKRKEGRGVGTWMELLEYWTKQGRGGSVGGAGSTQKHGNRT